MSLVAWLPLNGNLNNQGLKDITTSGTPTYKNGKLGKQALNLSVRIGGTIPSLNGAKTWSIAFWCLINEDDDLSTDWVDILTVQDQKSDNTTKGDFRWETCYGTNKGVAIGQYDNATLATMTSNGAALTSKKGDWHHCVAVVDYENSLVSIYLDGNLSYTRTHAGGHLTGTYGIGQTNQINGAIQDVRFYDHALSIKEVKELSKGLTIHYALKGTGTNPNLAVGSRTLNNSSGNNTNYTHETINYDGEIVRRITTVNTNSYGPWCSVFTNSRAVVGKTYTWSMYIRGNSNFTFTSFGHECGGRRTVNVTPEWQYITHTWVYTESSYSGFTFYGSSGTGGYLTTEGSWIEIKNFKIEEGSEATPYIPHVDETYYSVISTNDNIEYDLTGNGHNGTYLGTPTFANESPRYNNCMYFDGDTTGVTWTDERLYQCIGQPHTIAFWIKPDSENGNRSVYFSHYISDGWSMAVEKTASNVLRYYWSGNPDYNNSAFTITDDEWIFIAIVRESETSTKFYKNGVLINTYTTKCATPTSGSPTWYIGRDIRTGTTCYKGYMSDFRLYASPLSDADIKELYQTAAQIDDTGKIYCKSLVEV